MGIAMRRSAGVQPPSSRISAALILLIGILVSQAAAKPQSGEDQLEGFYDGHENKLFQETNSRPRRSVGTSEAGTNRIWNHTTTPGINAIYIHGTRARTWAEARKFCQEYEGHLAIINSIRESEIIGNISRTDKDQQLGSADSNYALIGFYQPYKNTDDYGTIDGRSLEQAGFAEWDAGKSQTGKCGAVTRYGKLSTVDCDKKYAFFCEVPPLNNVAPAGPVGPQGIPGNKGDKGIAGSAGLAGKKGEPGEKGMRGAAGVNGSKGDTGPVGPTGVKGNRGDLGPKGSPGLVGPPGSPGSNGANGSKGDKGEPGKCSCPAGLKGEKGDPGTAGVPGLPGQHGVPGTNGLNGRNGGHGFDGRDGEEGESGAEGEDGSQGDKGERGDKGDRGSERETPRHTTKRTGPNGVPGPQGPKGEVGSPGPRGEPGLGYDAACFALLSNLQYSRGGGLIDGEQAPTFSSNINFAEDCREFITKAYEQISRASSPEPTQPDGQKESPAKTCKHLFVAYPDKPSGEYWMDPNVDDISDAILVYCDAEKRATCITPESSGTLNISYIGFGPEVWLSKIDDKWQITYGAATNQINALQALSSHAEQTVTYHCLRSVAYFDTETQTHKRGLTLLAWNDAELEPRGSRHFRYDVTSDGCQDRLDEWKETVITYRTNQPARLPVLDVGLRDVGKPDQQFSVEIGQVCFK